MPNFISSNIVTTRKEHTCYGCRRIFPKGARLQRNTYVEDREIYSLYMCCVCEEYIKQHYSYQDEYSEGDVQDGDPEAWEEVRLEVEGAKV